MNDEVEEGEEEDWDDDDFGSDDDENDDGDGGEEEKKEAKEGNPDCEVQAEVDSREASDDDDIDEEVDEDDKTHTDSSLDSYDIFGYDSDSDNDGSDCFGPKACDILLDRDHDVSRLLAISYMQMLSQQQTFWSIFPPHDDMYVGFTVIVDLDREVLTVQRDMHYDLHAI